MEITTRFAPGDNAWIFNGDKVMRATIGQVRVTVTDSKGTGDTMFDNYAPQKRRTEEYMCVETGVGGGSVYTLGVHIFDSEDECKAAHAELLAEIVAKDAENKERLRRNMLAEEASLRIRLARIEELKAEAA